MKRLGNKYIKLFRKPITNRIYRHHVGIKLIMLTSLTGLI